MAANPRRVKEQSHLEDMRAAVRGDRERAEQARRRSTENVRAFLELGPEEAPAPEPTAVPEPPPAVGRHRFLRRRR